MIENPHPAAYLAATQLQVAFVDLAQPVIVSFENSVEDAQQAAGKLRAANPDLETVRIRNVVYLSRGTLSSQDERTLAGCLSTTVTNGLSATTGLSAMVTPPTATTAAATA